MIAVNDVVPSDNLTYLLRYDTVYGRYSRPVTARGDSLIVDGRPVRVLACRDHAALPWAELGVDLVLECTGAFRREGGPGQAPGRGRPVRHLIDSGPGRDHRDRGARR